MDRIAKKPDSWMPDIPFGWIPDIWPDIAFFPQKSIFFSLTFYFFFDFFIDIRYPASRLPDTEKSQISGQAGYPVHP